MRSINPKVLFPNLWKLIPVSRLISCYEVFHAAIYEHDPNSIIRCRQMIRFSTLCSFISEITSHKKREERILNSTRYSTGKRDKIKVSSIPNRKRGSQKVRYVAAVDLDLHDPGRKLGCYYCHGKLSNLASSGCFYNLKADKSTCPGTGLSKSTRR